MSSQPQAAPSAPAKSGSKLPVLAAVLLVLGGGGYVAYRRLGSHAPARAPAKEPVVPIDPGVVELEPFILNLADPAGDRFFRLNLRLLIDRKEAVARAEAGLPQVKLRDRVLSVLSKKRASQLTSVEGKEALRAELLAAVDALFSERGYFAGGGRGKPAGGEGEGGEEAAVAEESPATPVHVLDVLFTEFLVQ